MKTSKVFDLLQMEAPSTISAKSITWRLAGTGLAASQTVFHVLPGISMRELNLPFFVWLVFSLSVNKGLFSN